MGVDPDGFDVPTSALLADALKLVARVQKSDPDVVAPPPPPTPADPADLGALAAPAVTRVLPAGVPSVPRPLSTSPVEGALQVEARPLHDATTRAGQPTTPFGDAVPTALLPRAPAAEPPASSRRPERAERFGNSRGPEHEPVAQPRQGRLPRRWALVGAGALALSVGGVAGWMGGPPPARSPVELAEPAVASPAPTAPTSVTPSDPRRAIHVSDPAHNGCLDVTTRPTARVSVGKKTAKTPVKCLELPAGAHRVVLESSAARVREELLVTIRAGEVTRLHRDLGGP